MAKTNFRLTTGKNGTAWGEQKVIAFGQAHNAIDFLKEVFSHIPQNEREDLKKITWVDAGSNTIPIAVMNLIF